MPVRRCGNLVQDASRIALKRSEPTFASAAVAVVARRRMIPPKPSRGSSGVGNHENGRRESQGPKGPKRMIEEAPVRIVEREGRHAAHGLPTPDPIDKVPQRDHVEVAADPLDLPLELRLVHMQPVVRQGLTICHDVVVAENHTVSLPAAAQTNDSREAQDTIDEFGRRHWLIASLRGRCSPLAWGITPGGRAPDAIS